MQKLLIIAGLIILITGLCWPLIQKSALGKLPGDIKIEGENSNFYFPIVTCIVISIIFSLIFNLFKK